MNALTWSSPIGEASYPDSDVDPVVMRGEHRHRAVLTGQRPMMPSVEVGHRAAPALLRERRELGESSDRLLVVRAVSLHAGELIGERADAIGLHLLPHLVTEPAVPGEVRHHPEPVAFEAPLERAEQRLIDPEGRGELAGPRRDRGIGWVDRQTQRDCRADELAAEHRIGNRTRDLVEADGLELRGVDRLAEDITGDCIDHAGRCRIERTGAREHRAQCTSAGLDQLGRRDAQHVDGS